MTEEEFLDAIIRHQVLVEGHKEDQSSEYLAATALLLASFLAQLNSLGVNRLNEVPLSKINRVISILERSNAKVAKKLNRKLKADLASFAREEFEFESKALSLRAGNRGTATKKELAKEVETTPLSADGSLLDEFLVAAIAGYNRKAKTLLRRSWAEGTKVSDVIQEVRGTRARRYQDGLIGGAFVRNVRTMVNTAVQHVSSTVRLVAMSRANVGEYRWVSILDSRTSAICRSLDGRTFVVGQGPRPPAHLNCRSTISAVTGPPRGTRPAEGGAVPAATTYYQWLKKQSQEFQDAVLGPQRGKVFRSGMSAQRFSELNLNKTFRPLTLEEMKALEPEVFKRVGVLPND